MHTVQVPIAGLDNTVTRPVVLAIVDQVKSMTRIDVDTVNLFKSSLDELRQISRKGKNKVIEHSSPLDKYVSVTMTETYPEDSYATTPVNYSEHREFFKDNNARLYLKPVYVDTEVNLEFTYRDRSKTAVTEWLSNMRVLVSQMMDVNTHSLHYKYLVPPPIMELIIEVYTLREKIAPYKQFLEEYIEQSSDGRLRIVTDSIGKDLELAVDENQIGVQGFYDFTANPSEIENDKDYYSVSFSYRFRYQKPISIQAVYPTTVHNQLLDSRFIIDINLIQDQPDYHIPRDQYLESLKDLDERFRFCHNARTGILTIPYFDKWEPPIDLKYTSRIASILITISETDRRSLVNLNELGELELDPDILSWIAAGENTHITKLYDSIIHIGLYKNQNNIMYTDSIVVDASLNVYSKIDLDLRSEYRLAISLVTDTSTLPDAVLKRLVLNRTVVVKYLESLNLRLKFGSNYGGREVDYMDKVNQMSDIELLRHLRVAKSGYGLPKTHMTTTLFALKEV